MISPSLYLNPSLHCLSPVQLQRRVRVALVGALRLTTTPGEQKYVSQQPGESLVTWLLLCWDTVSLNMKLDRNEAKQLGSLSQDAGIDKGIGKRTETLSLWT